MAKFCKYCGKMLQEGEICSCTNQQNQPASEYQQPESSAQQSQNQQPQAQQPLSTSSSFFSELFGFIKIIFKAPYHVGCQVVKECKFKTALGFISIQALAVALLLLSFSSKINGFMNRIAGMGEIPTQSLMTFHFPSATIFFVGLIVTFGAACLLALLLMLFVKLFRGSTDYKSMLCVSGVGSIFSAPFVIVALLISLFSQLNINPLDGAASFSMIMNAFYVPICVALLGNALSVLVLFSVMNSGSTAGSDKNAYIVFIANILGALVLGFVIKEIFPSCLPISVQNALSGVDNIGNIFESLF